VWHKEYRDYPLDAPLKKERLEPQKGLIGCEMHEPNGWGETYHNPRDKRKPGLIATLLGRVFALFGGKEVR
jgi:hypothetical protein